MVIQALLKEYLTFKEKLFSLFTKSDYDVCWVYTVHDGEYIPQKESIIRLNHLLML